MRHDAEMQSPAKQIGIAVVEWEGRYLVGVRSAGQVLAGCAEFPGGKCRAGETPDRCAARECLEETGLPVRAEALLLTVTHRYPHGEVELHFWRCQPEQPSLLREDHQGFRWVSSQELSTLPFPAANQPVLAILGNVTADANASPRD